MKTTPESGPPIRNPAYWDAFDNAFYSQLEPLRRIPPEQFTEEQWHNLRMFALQQIAELHYLVRAIALDPHVPPLLKAPRARKPKTPTEPSE
ncbi:MAG: hypothetical protein H0U76_13915 [Ktedonobacteraceae bacterium]|nr:hypothetical protein [Ktedonobacteraceae bacterium]